MDLAIPFFALFEDKETFCSSGVYSFHNFSRIQFKRHLRSYPNEPRNLCNICDQWRYHCHYGVKDQGFFIVLSVFLGYFDGKAKRKGDAEKGRAGVNPESRILTPYLRSMCGRYTATTNIEELSEVIPGKFQYPLFTPSYNIAPSQKAPIVTYGEDVYNGELAKWGLVPHWMKDAKKPFINARSETIFEKPSFKYLYAKNRCVVLADGFYEWSMFGDIKRPVYFYLEEHKPFAFAGYWENDWKDENGKTFVIMTTDANEDLEDFHHRMPVMLTKEGVEAWLRGGRKEVLRPFTEPVRHHVVSRIVNSPAHNSPECVEAVETEEGENK